MTDGVNLKKAQSVYKSLCDMLDEKKVRYEKHPEDLVVTFTMTGEDIPMNFILNIDAKRDLVRLISPIPVKFEGDKRVIGAIATCQATYCLADGSFDYDCKNGNVSFRMTSSYKDSLISKDVLEYMIAIAGMTVDEFNDKFLMLAKGVLSIEDFLKQN